jgi:valyl-tRNA synthetase
MKELEKKYDHKIVEKNKYKLWMDTKVFEHELNDNKKKFSIIMPPPNVTGKLHLGHAWDGSIQDFLIRYKKLNGFDTVWIPGMDHAGIATQVKVEQRLKEQNISKYDLGRENFIKKVVEWKEEYAATIRQQWEKLGLGVDYSKEVFTFSDELQKIVKHVFVDMYNKKLIYKGKRIVNWDVKQKTAISNIEVIYKETNGSFYFFKYFLENKKDFLTVATTRPETMYGDVCVVVNPNDKRYKDMIGKKVFNPVNGELIPIIADDYVEIEFGTGAMKCTPAHDINDYEIGLRHNFEPIICMNEDGTLNERAGALQGVERLVARKKIIEFTKENNSFLREEELIHQVGYSERSGEIVEPYLSDQWFVKMDELAKQVLDIQGNKKNKINFHPERFDDTLTTWMSNAHDWTISRQLWWGHRIPAWYNNTTGETYVGVEEPKDIADWTQDPDVLDTWFSSGLWPFAAMGFDIEKEIKNQDLFFQKYFPSNVLVTGYDIIFFWVARMIFQTYNQTKTIPFKDVLIHGLIRDEQGRKMSKSLGNGIDPMDVIDEVGCDSLRYFLLTNSSPGLDLRYSTEKIKSSWNFINKIWNASRYVLMNIPDDFKLENNFNDLYQENEIPVINKWILNKLSDVNKEIKINLDNYEFTVAGKLIYDFVWTDYCSWFIELSKVNIESDNVNVVAHTKKTLLYVLKNILIMLHPFIPFVTEELYLNFGDKETILKEEWMKDEFKYDTYFIDELIAITSAVREFRIKNNLKKDIKLNFVINLKNSKYENVIAKHLDDLNSFLVKTCNADLSGEQSEDMTEMIVKDYVLSISNNDFIDKDSAIDALNDQIEKIKIELQRSEKILANNNFLAKASAEKVQNEKDKFDDYQKQYHKLLEALSKLK